MSEIADVATGAAHLADTPGAQLLAAFRIEPEVIAQGRPIDLHAGPDIILQIILRRGSSGFHLSVNDRLDDAWGIELRRPCLGLTGQEPVEFRLRSGPAGIAVELVGGPTLIFPRLTALPHGLRIAEAPGITGQIAPRPDLPAEAAPPPVKHDAESAPAASPEEFGPAAQPILAFARLLHLPSPEPVLEALTQLGLAVPADLAGEPNLALCRCLAASFDGLIEFGDLWFINDAQLRCRLASPILDGSGIPATLTCLQPDLAEGRLLPVAQQILSTDGITFVDLNLANAFAPVLIAIHEADGRLLGCSLLPFPSLCRGGAHAAELAMLSEAPNQLANLRAASDGLLRDALGWGAAPPGPSVARLEVDMTGAIGAERIFAEGFKTWLAAIPALRAVPLRLEAVQPAEVRAFLQDALRPMHEPAGAAMRIAARESAGHLALRLPADALPSLSAIFSRRLRAVAPGEAAGGAHAVADAVTGRPGWAVSFPPMGAMLAELQPRQAAPWAPCLIPLDADASGPTAPSAEVPLAIRFLDPPRTDDALLLRPVAPDAPGGLLRRDLSVAERQGISISVILPAHLDPAAVQDFLDGLRLQTLADAVDVILLGRAADAARNARLGAVLASHFPGRFQIIDPGAAGPSASLNLAAAAAKGHRLLIVNEPVILHDARALEVLATLLLEERAASAGCVMLREVVQRKGRALAFRAGGLFPSHISCLSVPRLIVTEPDVQAALPLATYPVLGHSFRLVMLRASAWAALGGLDAERFPADNADLDFAVRALRAGHCHLCTSVVTAGSVLPPQEREALDPLGTAFIEMPAWEAIARSVTILRALA